MAARMGYQSARKIVIRRHLWSFPRLGRYISSETSPTTADAPAEEVRLSDACVAQLRRISADGSTLRLAVDGGGCSGFQYVFSLQEPGTSLDPEDMTVERDGARVVVDPVSLGYIRGATIDYHQELIRSAFRVLDNPQSETGCSCGASFAIKID